MGGGKIELEKACEGKKIERKVREKFDAAGPLLDRKFGREKNKETLESRRIVLQLFEGSYPLRWYVEASTRHYELNFF